MKAKLLQDMDDADMEIDELDSSPPPPVAGPSKERVLQPTNQQKLPSVIQSLPPEPVMRQAGNLPSLPLPAPTSKGKERALELPVAASSTKSRPPKETRSHDVISLDSDEDDAPESVIRETAARPTLPRNPSIKGQQLANINAELASRVSLQSPSLPPQRPPGEERTRVFRLPPKVASALQNVNKRTPTALRNFLDEKYEEVELELRSPLRRIDEIPKDDSIRLVYIELELPPHELAIPLPRDCLRSQTPSTEEREEKRRAFAVQQIVQFAKEGREAETTRSTPAYLIVVFKPDIRPSSSTTNSSLAKQPSTVRNTVPPPMPASSAVLVPDIELANSVEKTKKKDKKRKRLEVDGLTDDTASVTSVDSVARQSNRKEKPSSSKQARKSLESTAAPKVAASIPSGPSREAANSPLRTTITQPTPPAALAGPSLSVPHIFSGRPRLITTPHSMYGSLSHSSKDSREKPRVFFRSEKFAHGYVTASMRGHLHYWNKGMPASILSSEDKHTHASLSVQTAIWSDEHKLAVLGYVSTSAAAVANMQLVKFNSSKVCFNDGATIR